MLTPKCFQHVRVCLTADIQSLIRLQGQTTDPFKQKLRAATIIERQELLEIL